MSAYLGRDRYERTASCEDARAGMRNGYCPTTVIILSRESDHAFDQGFSDEDSVIDGTVNLRSCGRSANHISLIRHTRPGESRRRTGENRPRIAQVDSAHSEASLVVTAGHRAAR